MLKNLGNNKNVMKIIYICVEFKIFIYLLFFNYISDENYENLGLSK